MNDEKRAELDKHYKDAASWAEDRFVARDRSARIAWVVAGIAVMVALAEAFALAALLPLKTVVPYTLLVDKQTGYVQALEPLDAERISPDRALTQSFLVQYVIARETFDYSTIKSSYQKVAGLSGEPVRSAYIKMMQASNPQSPLTRYPQNTIVETRVKSVSPLSQGTALVRFDTVRKDADGGLGDPQPWVATIGYRYTREPNSVEERFQNPLGFAVTRYRRDPEALPAVAQETPRPAQESTTSADMQRSSRLTNP